MAKKASEPISFPIPLSHEVERLFDEMIHRPWGGAREARGWNPSVDHELLAVAKYQSVATEMSHWGDGESR